MNAILKWCEYPCAGKVVTGKGASNYVSGARVLGCFTQTCYRKAV